MSLDSGAAGVTISDGDADSANLIEQRLLGALRSALPQAENQSITLAAHDSGGALVGGLVAATSYSWLLLKALWVAESHRRSGLGSALLQRAEQRARGVDCRGAWLDTSNPESMRFYQRRGYAVFAQLENTLKQRPPQHRRWFMKKVL